MNRNKCSHYENRKKICAPCGKKISFGKIDPNKFLINKKTENLIKKFIKNDFNIEDSKFPLSICRTCYLTLLDCEKGLDNRPLQDFPNYEDILLPKETRFFKNTCNCFICITARFKGHIKTMKGKGHKRNLKKVILKSNGLYGNGSLQPDQRIDSKVTNEKRTCQLPICNKCFQIVGKGIFHPCNNAKENLMKLVEMLPESNQQQIATTIIKNSQETCVDDELSLSTSGRKLRIILNPTEKKILNLTKKVSR